MTQPRMTDGKSAHRFCVGMRLSFHEITLDVSTEFIAKHVSPFFPKRLATRRAYEVHDDKLPTPPQLRRQQSLAPLQKCILRVRKERHKGRDKPNSLLFGKRSVVAQALSQRFGQAHHRRQPSGTIWRSVRAPSARWPIERRWCSAEFAKRRRTTRSRRQSRR